jgi:hypothetical protein
VAIEPPFRVPPASDSSTYNFSVVTGSTGSSSGPSQQPIQREGISGVPLTTAALGAGAANLFPSFVSDANQNLNSTSTQAVHQSEQRPEEYKFVPKGELHSLYGKHPRRKIISASNYITFHDAGEAHMLKWSSVFICPITGELFLSGRYAGASATVKNHVVWFVKKTQAEHAAAAWAFDCLSDRDQGDAASKRLSQETPYNEKEAKYGLPGGSVSSDVMQNIRRKQEEIRRTNGLGPVPLWLA